MTAANASLPLAGLKVLEMHAIGPVPFAGMVLRSLGATVTRVMPPADPGLGVPQKTQFDLLNLDKQPLVANLKDPAGIAALHEALAQSDVLIEGWRPGVLERLGLAPDVLLARYPKLVIGRLSGFGTRGDLAPRAGHDITYLAMAGLLNAIGTKERPVVPLNVIADFGGGAMHLLLGVFAQLVRRGMTGQGGVATTSILAGTVGLTPMFFGMLAGGTWNLERENNLLDGSLPFYRTYPTRDGRFVAIGALENKFYCDLLKVLELDGEFSGTTQWDKSTWPRVIERFSQRIAERTRDEWAVVGDTCDCCMAPVLTFEEAARHPHNLAMGLYTSDPIAKPATLIEFS